MTEPEQVGTANEKPVPVYACLYAPEFAAQALLRLRHALRSRSVAVLEGVAPEERVCAANALGRSQGIANGMTRVEAESFAGLALLRRSLREEAEARAAIEACAAKYTPSIEDVSTEVAAVAVLDLAGTSRLFGEPLSVAEKLRRELVGFGVHASIAVSANFHAAITLARSGSGVRRIAPGEEQQTLAPLLLSALPLTAAQLETLSLWGIRTVGGLAALPERALIARMGQAGKRLRSLARGEQPHLFQPREPSFTLREAYEFDSPVEVLESLLFVLAPMLEQLLLRAQERALALASVTVRLRLEGGGEHARTVRPALPVSDRMLLLKLLQLDLGAHPPPAAVLSVELTAEPGDTSRVQLGLFSPQLPEASKLDVMLMRLRALVGDGGVGSPELKDTHAPDSFAMEGFSVGRRKPGTAPHRGAPALRRLRPPQQIALHVARLGAPLSFWYSARQYAVIKAFGPWRTGGEWWGSALWASEQWDVIADGKPGTVDQGQLCCRIAHDLVARQWLLEAIYD